jgi:hypothetical protein
MTRRSLPLVLALLPLLGAACAAPPRSAPHPGIESLWSGYLEMTDERALALAGEPDRVWVGAASGGHATRREAEESVLAKCWQRRAARRLQDPCRLYATGGEIVW